MPKLNDTTMDQLQTATGSYGFSATKLDNLGASEYTLVSIIVDESGSVSYFKSDLEKCLKEAVLACKYSPRANNLMIRVVTFANALREVHGFKLLETVNESDYDNCLNPSGATALFDAAQNSIEATITYSKSLSASYYTSNGLVIVITDGDDNKSTATANSVKESLMKAVLTESLESLNSILVGVNVTNNTISNYLDNFHKATGFSQYVELNKADAKTLARLGDFISKSISSTSQALGTGGPSKSLTF